MKNAVGLNPNQIITAAREKIMPGLADVSFCISELFPIILYLSIFLLEG